MASTRTVEDRVSLVNSFKKQETVGSGDLHAALVSIRGGGLHKETLHMLPCKRIDLSF